ncbi:MAG: hypothetical protein WD734_00410 [Dehalococcoidia bacterium]
MTVHRLRQPRVARHGAALALGVLLALTLAACDADATTGASTPGTATADVPAATSPQGGGAASAAMAVAVASVGTHGDILTDADGLTLYTFTADTSGNGESTCYEDCATAWPPAAVDGGSLEAGEGLPGELGSITRDDGDTQLTYEGWPLYLFQRDEAPGDVGGHGIESFGGTWEVASADGGSADGTAEAPAAGPYGY